MNECGGGSTTPIHSPHRPPPWQHSFQFSPRFRLITLTSLRLPLSSALIRYPLHFTPFYRSLSLCVSLSVARLALSPFLSFSLSEDLKGSLFESGECLGFGFISQWQKPVGIYLFRNERFAQFCLFKGDDKQRCWAHESERVKHDTFCLLLSKMIIFLLPIQPCSYIFF